MARQIPQAPANLTVPCPKLPDPEGRAENMSQLLVLTAEVAGMYRDCARRHEGLAAWARDVSGGRDMTKD